MKKIYYISIIFTFFLGSCMYMTTASLPEENALIQDSDEANVVSVPVKDYNNGILESFNKSIFRWQVSHSSAMSIQQKDTVLRIDMTGVGPGWEELTREYPPLDFSQSKVIIVRAKVDGWKIPVIRLDLIDKLGKMTNGLPSSCKIAPREGYLDYVFRYNNAFKQSWPSKDLVDSTSITKLRFNVNGGGDPYSGTLYFDEIRVTNQYPE